METVLVYTIMCFSAFTFGFAGFGFSLIAVPLLAVFMPIQQTVAIAFPSALYLNVLNVLTYRREFPWKAMLPFLVLAYGTVPLGYYLGHLISAVLLKKCLAVFILFSMVATQSTRGYQIFARYSDKPGIAWLMGCLSGFFQGAYTTGGPPAVLYILSRTQEDPVRAKAIMNWYFLILNIFVTLPVFAVGGMFTPQVLMKTLYFSPVVITGALAGMRIFSRISNLRYRQGVSVLLVIAAFLLWFRT